MAISSVARKATIRRDDTLLKTQAIINRQKNVAKQLELSQQKIAADQAEAKAKRSASNLKLAMATGDIKDTHFAKGFEPMMKKFQDMNASGAPQKDIENQILDMDGYTKMANAAFNDSTQLVDGLVGSEEQRKLRNKDAVIAELSKYTDASEVREWDKTDAQDAINNNLATYNIPETVKSWSATQQELVTNSVKIKTGNLFSQSQEKTQTARFLVIDPATNDWKRGDDGKPIAVISNENLSSFENFSKGNTLAINDYIEKNTTATGGDGAVVTPDPSKPEFYRYEKEGNKPTRLEAMEAILRESGAFNIDEETATKVVATPKEDTNLVKSRLKMANVSTRLDFIQKPAEMLSVIKSGRGVVDRAPTGEKDKDGNPTYYETKQEAVKGGVQYTIVTDPNKLVTNDLMTVEIPDGQGGTTRMPVISNKKQKIQTSIIKVDDKNPIAGLIQLSQLFNATVDAKDRISPDDLLVEWNKRKEGSGKDVVDLTTIGGKKKEEGDGTIDLTKIGN